MLPKKQRVTKKLFDQVYTLGKSFHAPHLFMKVLKTGKTEQNKASVVVSKKVAKKAHDRNTIKRRTLSLLNPYIKAKKNGLQVIVFMKKGADSITFQDLKKEIDEVWKKII